MFNRLSPTYKGIVLALTGFTAYAFGDICAKFLSQHYPVNQVITFEAAIAGIIMLTLFRPLGGARGLFQRDNLRIHSFRIVLNVIIMLSLTYCYSQLPIALVYVMIFSVPLVTPLLGIFIYGEKVFLSHWLAIIAGFIGVIIALRPGTAEFNPLLLLALACTFLIALLYIISRSLNGPSLFALGFAPVMGSAILSSPLLVLHFTPVSAAHWPVFLAIGSCATIGMICVSLAFRIAPSAVVAPFLYTEMIWGVLFGYLLFGDKPDAWMLIGSALIIASGFFIIETERRGQGKNANASQT
ncbi:MAG: DMT family transporter [Alphaproteobacteria bacterium]